MLTSRMLVALAVAGTGAALPWWLLSPDAPVSPPRLVRPVSAPASLDTAEVEREVEALSAELAALRRQQARRAKAVGPEGKGTPEPVRRAEAAQDAARLARREQLYGLLEEASSKEARDPLWARRTEALISQAVSAIGSGSRLAHSECRSTLCRVELVHEGADARIRAVDGLLSTPGLQGETVVRHLQQGNRLVSLVYVAREGERLPPLRP